MHAVWADVFGIPADTPQKQDLVIEAVMGFRLELDHMRKQLDTADVPASLTQAVFGQLKDAANPAALDQSWGNYAGKVSGADCRLVLAWAGWVLREQVDLEIEPQQFMAIEEHLLELESLLEDSQVPRRFVTLCNGKSRTFARLCACIRFKESVRYGKR